MADFSIKTTKRILSWFFTQDEVSRPAEFYLALYGNSKNEIPTPGYGYARQPVAFKLNPHVPVNLTPELVNSHAVTFTAGAIAWSVNYLALFETATGGELLWKIHLGGSKLVLPYESLLVQPNAILIKLT